MIYKYIEDSQIHIEVARQKYKSIGKYKGKGDNQWLDEYIE